jgi:plastocyanin
MRSRGIVLFLAAAAGLVFPAPAPAAAQPAAPEIVTAFNVHFVPEMVTLERGATLQFFNPDGLGRLEFDGHTLTEVRPDGPPRFGSGLVTFPTAAEVKGVSSLPPGRYAFRCEIHPFMRGTLVIT